MRTEVRSKNYFFETVKAVIVAVIISLVLLLIAALLIKVLNIADQHLSIVNQIIKSVSIFVSCIVCLRLPANRWLRGLVVGVLYVTLAFFIFAAMSGTIELGLSLLNDVAIAAITGILSGIIAKLIRRDNI